MSFEDVEITLDTVLEEEKVLLSYEGTVLMSSNNLSIINGAKGSMKTTQRDFLIMNLLSPQPGFKSSLEGSILIMDTEMSPRLIQTNLSRFRGNVSCRSMKKVDAADRIQCVETRIEEYKPEVLVLDGTRDLLINSNDPTESMKLINKLMYWTYTYNLHIVNIVHSITREGTIKTKGTFGSELENKAETIIGMTKYRDAAKAECIFSRETKPFQSYKITLNEHNKPIKI